MAIFSLHHSTIGRTTHAPGAASSHARYITRREACTEIIGARMPTGREELFGWLDEQEQVDRKNARVIDKVVVALPAELSHEQNVELVTAFAERMTEGRARWAAGIHDGPADADNPHAHVIFRDRDVETGQRVMLLSEAGSTERIRAAWEQEVNIALERAGFEERVDRRTLEEQGIDREPQLHVGAAAMEMQRRGIEFESNAKEITRLIDGARAIVTVNYPVIDEGKTRFEENEERKLRNLELEKLEQLAGMDQVLRARDYLNALTWERREPPPNDDAVLDYLVWQEANRLPIAKEGRRDPEESDEALIGSDPGERGPKRDASDLVAGAGLALIGRIAESLESLFDGSPAEEREQEVMTQEQKKTPHPNNEQQRTLTEAEQEAARQAYLEAFLRQRDRERHIDRGR